MEYFEESGLDYNTLIESIRQRYGQHIHIMNRKKILMGGFLGFGKKEGWCVTGYVSDSVFQPQKKTDLSGNLKRLEELMERNDFSSRYIKRLVSAIGEKSHEESLKSWGYVVKKARDFIECDIEIYHSKNLYTPAVTALIGPTGVGKTTTIAKLAAMYKKAGKQVGIISTDRYKVGADKQIEALAGVMGIPYVSVGNADGVRRQIEVWTAKADRILIDTPGRNPRESDGMISLGNILGLTDSVIEKFLCVSATTKMSDLVEILWQFNMLNYNAVICTKMDETFHAGNLISSLHHAGKSLGYITMGQKISEGIEIPKAGRVFEFIEGFDAV